MDVLVYWYYINCSSIIENGQTKYVLEAVLTIPEEKQKLIIPGTKLVVAMRVSLDDTCTKFYPYPFVEKKERWIGTRFGLFKGQVNKNATSSQDVKFDSLEKLKLNKTW